MTKDAVAGRIRRLLAMADKRAPRTWASPTPRPSSRPDMLDELTVPRTPHAEPLPDPVTA